MNHLAFKILFISCLHFSSIAIAQKVVDPLGYGTIHDIKRLYFLNLQYTQSWVKSDTTTYNSLLWADDFVHQNSGDGRLIPKKDLAMAFGKPRFANIQYFYPEEVEIHFIAPNCAMIFSQTSLKLIGQDNVNIGRYNDVYVKRSGQWICVAANTVSQSVKPQPTEKVIVPAFVNIKSYYQGSEDDIKELERINSNHAEGFLRSKSDLIKDILADDYVLQDTDCKLYSRQDAIGQIDSGKAKENIAFYRVVNVLIRFVSEDVAMIHAGVISTLKTGKEVGVQYNDIYVKRAGRWTCVSGNNTAILNN